MKTRQLIALLFAAVALSSCVKDPEIPAGQTFGSDAFVTVTTYTAWDITQTTAETGGSIDVFGNTKVTGYGICWSSNHNPTTEDNHITCDVDKDYFFCTITGLTAGTTYYVRAYAINSKGATYGNEESFTTAQTSNNQFTINVSANPSDGGTATGGGTYQQGQSCTVTASPNTGYTFLRWTVNGNKVSTNASYTFTVNSNRTLVAQFQSQPQAPTGAINGLFSVSASKQVWFSQGNLQYIGSASAPYWKFAENQWECLGTTTGQNSSYHNVDRDLFGWGTSGWYNGNTYYMPYDVEDAYPSYYQYGPSDEHNLEGEYANYDWGVYNSISNGGNTPGQWRTLTHAEWGYVLFTRNTSSGIRFAKAVVNGINGIIVLPDDWAGTIYSLGSTNNQTASYNSNTISSSIWTTVLQPHGAVFLPAGGSRAGTSVLNAETNGYYWSTSYYNSYQAKAVFFSNSQLKTGEPDFRYYGRSVRLVQDF